MTNKVEYMSENLPYFNPKRQARKHLNTLQKRERYDFTADDIETVSPATLGEEEILYDLDERPGAVNGDIETTDESTVENAAAFLDGEIGEDCMTWGFRFESEEGNYGAVAAYSDPENPEVIEDFPDRQVIAPSTIVHVFEAREGTEQVDIRVERYSSPGRREAVH